MKRSEMIRAYILEHGEEIVVDTILLAEHQSTTIRKEYVDRCGDALIALVKERLGIDPIAVYPQEQRGKHMFFEIGEGRPAALLIGHYDTVWNIDALPLKREGNVLAGPGVYDMKYGLVAGIWAIKALQATGGLDCKYGLFFNSDEEMGSRTSRACFEPIAKEYANALILEPTVSHAVKVGRKSTGDFKIHINGRAAHAGTDYTAGRSAILEAAILTQKLFGLTALEKGTTLNVGVMNGGSKFNVIAANADMHVDVRVTSKAEGERITREIESLQPAQDGVTFEITGGMNRPPFEYNEINRGLFETACAAAAEYGIELEGIKVGGGSDANFTSSWGIPSLDGLGAVGDGAHAEHEHVLIQESLEHTAILAVLLTKL